MHGQECTLVLVDGLAHGAGLRDVAQQLLVRQVDALSTHCPQGLLIIDGCNDAWLLRVQSRPCFVARWWHVSFQLFEYGCDLGSFLQAEVTDLTVSLRLADVSGRMVEKDG